MLGNGLAANVVEHVGVIPSLAHGLEWVLRSPGVHFVKDPTSGHYNFSQSLRSIDGLGTRVRVPDFVTSSRDTRLAALATREEAEYTASTSSTTEVLAMLSCMLSHMLPVNTSNLSPMFSMPTSMVKRLSRSAVVVARPRGSVISIDSENSNIPASNRVLMDLGKAVELLLTMDEDEFRQHLTTPPNTQLPDAYLYTRKGKFLLRSQLDAQGLTAHGPTVFDLKTRAIHAIRHNTMFYLERRTEQLLFVSGALNSYEREYYDMLRSAMVKYFYQMKMGAMQGIFMAYHNTQYIHGFEYIDMPSVARALFWNEHMADLMYERSFLLWQHIIDALKLSHTHRSRIVLSFDRWAYALRVFVHELPSDSGWSEVSTTQHVSYDKDEKHSRAKTLSYLRKFFPEAKLRCYRVTTDIFRNGSHVTDAWTAMPRDQIEIFYSIEEERLSDDDKLLQYAIALRSCEVFQELAILP